MNEKLTINFYYIFYAFTEQFPYSDNIQVEVLK